MERANQGRKICEAGVSRRLASGISGSLKLFLGVKGEWGVLALAFVFVAGGFSGCVSWKSDLSAGGGFSEERIRRDVEFLAGPELKGRKTRTRGARLARRFLSRRFEALGLEAWGEAGEFEQDFVAGENVVGVLRGSDVSVADEYVLVVAHFDHLGKAGWAGYHAGAADNAAGVAVLLEMAERLARGEERLRRTVVLAAFDGEETGLLGAFAFTCREDFDSGKLAGVVNFDILGRKVLDVSENVLLALGTESFPELRADVLRAGGEAGVEVLPLGRDFALGRSDHAAFETYGIPWVFFTTGPFADYHEVTDTPEKLDHGLLARTVDLGLEVVVGLANAEDVERESVAAEGDREELRALYRLVGDVLEGGSDEENRELRGLHGRMEELLRAEIYGVAEREKLAEDLMRAAAPVLAGREMGRNGEAVLLLSREVYRDFPELAAEGTRAFVRHLLAHRPGVFRGAPAFAYSRAGVSEASVIVGDLGDGRMRLSCAIPVLRIEARIRSFGRVEMSVALNWTLSDWSESRGDLVDAVLLKWRGEPESGEVWGFALEWLTGEEAGEGFSEWLDWRLSRAGVRSESELFLRLAERATGPIRTMAVGHVLAVDRAAVLPLLRAMISDAEEEGWSRAWAVGKVEAEDGAELWEAVAELAESGENVVRPEILADASFPFHGSLIARISREWRSERTELAKTLGEVARGKLAELEGGR